MSSAARVSVLVPTLDEAGNIDRLIREVLEHARAASLDIDVIVVDDGSRDGTRELVRAWETGHPVTLVARDGERGLASAVLGGAARAGGEVVVVMDADLSHPPERIADLARPVLEGSSDMVIGSRYVRGGSTPGWPLRRRIASRGAAAAARVLTDPRDPLSGFFAVRRPLLLEAAKDALGFKVGLEVLVRAGDGLRVKEVPIAFKDRTAGRSKLGAGVFALYLKQLVELSGGSMDARMAPALLAGLAVDLCAFPALLAAGVDLAYAHVGALSISLLAAWFLSTRRPGPGDRSPGPGRLRALIAFAVIAFLAAPLRGGVLGVLVREMGWHPFLAFLPAMLPGGLVTALGCMFLVFPQLPGAPKRRAVRGRASAVVRWRAGAVGLLGHAALLRILHADLVAIASWSAAIGFSYLLARSLTDRSTGFRAALLLGSLPIFSGIGFFRTPDAPIAASWAGALRCAVLLIAPMALAAFGFGLSRLDARVRSFVLVFTFVSLAILVLASLFGEIGLAWTAPALLAGLPAMACGMIPGPGKVERWIARLWPPILIGLAALHGMALHAWS